jgi:hypothetical protein
VEITFAVTSLFSRFGVGRIRNRPNTNRHVHAHKCLHCTGIEPATSCVVGEYSHHYAKAAVNK